MPIESKRVKRDSNPTMDDSGSIKETSLRLVGALKVATNRIESQSDDSSWEGDSSFFRRLTAGPNAEELPGVNSPLVGRTFQTNVCVGEESETEVDDDDSKDECVEGKEEEGADSPNDDKDECELDAEALENEDMSEDSNPNEAEASLRRNTLFNYQQMADLLEKCPKDGSGLQNAIIECLKTMTADCIGEITCFLTEEQKAEDSEWLAGEEAKAKRAKAAQSYAEWEKNYLKESKNPNDAPDPPSNEAEVKPSSNVAIQTVDQGDALIQVGDGASDKDSSSLRRKICFHPYSMNDMLESCLNDNSEMQPDYTEQFGEVIANLILEIPGFLTDQQKVEDSEWLAGDIARAKKAAFKQKIKKYFDDKRRNMQLEKKNALESEVIESGDEFSFDDYSLVSGKGGINDEDLSAMNNSEEEAGILAFSVVSTASEDSARKTVREAKAAFKEGGVGAKADESTNVEAEAPWPFDQSSTLDQPDEEKAATFAHGDLQNPIILEDTPAGKGDDKSMVANQIVSVGGFKTSCEGTSNDPGLNCLQNDFDKERDRAISDIASSSCFTTEVVELVFQVQEAIDPRCPNIRAVLGVTKKVLTLVGINTTMDSYGSILCNGMSCLNQIKPELRNLTKHLLHLSCAICLFSEHTLGEIYFAHEENLEELENLAKEFDIEFSADLMVLQFIEKVICPAFRSNHWKRGVHACLSIMGEIGRTATKGREVKTFFTQAESTLVEREDSVIPESNYFKDTNRRKVAVKTLFILMSEDLIKRYSKLHKEVYEKEGGFFVWVLKQPFANIKSDALDWGKDQGMKNDKVKLYAEFKKF